MPDGSYVEYLKNRRANTNDTPGSRHVVTLETRYLKFEEDTHGTIGVKLEPSINNVVQICEFTKVAIVKDQEGRTYFRVMDGPYEGRLASMKSDAARRYLQKTAPANSVETLKVKYGRVGDEISPFKGSLRQQWATLMVDGQNITVTLNSIWNQGFTPIVPGLHRIMVPDGSHANVSTEGYRNTYPGRSRATMPGFRSSYREPKGTLRDTCISGIFPKAASLSMTLFTGIRFITS